MVPSGFAREPASCGSLECIGPTDARWRYLPDRFIYVDTTDTPLRDLTATDLMTAMRAGRPAEEATALIARVPWGQVALRSSLDAAGWTCTRILAWLHTSVRPRKNPAGVAARKADLRELGLLRDIHCQELLAQHQYNPYLRMRANEAELYLRVVADKYHLHHLEAYVAECHNCVSGALVGWWTSADDVVIMHPPLRGTQPTSLYIDSIYVYPAYRLRGVATALMNHVLAECQARDVQGATLNYLPSNTPAQAFWHSIGVAPLACTYQLRPS